MKVTKIMFSDIAASQFTELFNVKYGTKIQTEAKIKDGTPFVTVSFEDTPLEKIFLYAFEMGVAQQILMRKNQLFLTPDLYNLPVDDK